MDKFYNLTVDKQTTIVDAALQAFGTNGYKKTSVSDIANVAGISKAMVFHYFGTKKDLYLFLLDYCFQLIIEEIDEKFDKDITDFFERITMAATIKTGVIKKHHAALSYLSSVFFESNEEVKEDIKKWMFKSDVFRDKIAFEGMDYSKFKEGVDVKLVMKMLMWISEGFVNQAKSNQVMDLDNMMKDFTESMNLLKSNLYKEEYKL